ncbi:MAG: cation diffusion facilitator family transporter [Gemmatimonadota bacterium]|nr:cation diffusion facilitator family transporter [Gemmatimonadota bacterium]
MAHPTRRGIRSAQLGLLVNAALAGVKLVAGLVGNSYALVADAVESTADVLASIAVWGGLAIAAQPADEDHPYGHGKAEPLAASAVALMLLGAAVGIAAEAIQEIRTPHGPPEAWTLGVLVTVVLVKAVLSRRVLTVGAAIGSTAVKADAWHHLSDAVTSAAAFVGISLAVWGTRVLGEPAWAVADDWAALAATAVIAYNGLALLKPALHDLMDRMPGADVVAPIRRAAEAVPGVLAVEKLHVRRTGLVYHVTIHVQAEPMTPLDEAHALGHRVTDGIRAAVPQVDAVVVHMEPYGATTAAGAP